MTTEKKPIPHMSKDDAWDSLFWQSRLALVNYLKGEGKGDPDSAARARLAAGVLSSYTRHEATESAKDTTAVIIAKNLAENKEEFAAYLKASKPDIRLPQLPEAGK